MAVEVTDSNFDSIIGASTLPVVIDFWAEWCGPCRMLSPVIEELAEEYKDKVLIAKIDVDANPTTASKYGIRNIPTVLFIKDGEIKDKQVGAAPKSTIEAKIKGALL